MLPQNITNATKQYCSTHSRGHIWPNKLLDIKPITPSQNSTVARIQGHIWPNKLLDIKPIVPSQNSTVAHIQEVTFDQTSYFTSNQ